jgi:hypothetical protein
MWTRVAVAVATTSPMQRSPPVVGMAAQVTFCSARSRHSVMPNVD